MTISTVLRAFPLLCCLAAPLALSAPASALATYPLDPMQSDEMAELQKIAKASGKFSPDAIFSWAQIQEPSKREILNFRYGQPFSRKALVVAIEPKKKSSVEAVVDLRAGKVVSFQVLNNLQPLIAASEFDTANQVVDADPRIKAALQKRGYKFAGKVSDSFLIDTYAPGEDAYLSAHPRRAIRALFADKRGGVNIYGPYVEGLMALVDLDEKKVVKIYDYPGMSGVTAPHDIFSRKVIGPPRPGLKPLTISMPKGVSYTLKGNRVSWQNWDFRFSFNLREGLVLHQVGWREQGKLRSILYRGAISEMLVPYSDGSKGWLWREFFDSGEYGLGLNSTDVRAGKELPANAQTLPAILPDEDLSPSAYPDRIFIYERDGGPFVFHKQWTDGNRVYTRGRELVIGFVATVGNYDYFYYWVFKQDGSFQFAADLEGEILNKSVQGEDCEVCREQAQGGPGKTYISKSYDKSGTMVAPGILGVNHQHWVNLRLDFDIDGPVNSVKECNTVQLPTDEENEMGRAFAVAHTIFGKEKDAVRDCDANSNREWVVYNPFVKSSLGHPAGYEIIPGPNTSTSIPKWRWKEPAGFTSHHFWATVNKPNEMYAAGQYPSQAPKEYKDFLQNYAGDESVWKKDVVVWYNLGYTHLTKPEDYPIMPNGHIYVDFKPKGFFTRSAALDTMTIEMAPKAEEDEVKPDAAPAVAPATQ